MGTPRIRTLDFGDNFSTTVSFLEDVIRTFPEFCFLVLNFGALRPLGEHCWRLKTHLREKTLSSRPRWGTLIKS